MNDYGELDRVFANTDDLKNVVCEVEIFLQTQEGRIETAWIGLVDAEDKSLLVEYRYTMLELGRVELVEEVIGSINLDPEDEEEEAT